MLCCLLGNLSLPGLAQAWVAHSAGNDQALIAICTSSGVRMVSLDQAGDPSDFAGKAAAQSDPGTALPGQPGAGGSHCQACLGNGPEGLIHHWAATPAPRLTGELSLNNADAGTVPGTPVWPGAPTRAPPASAD